MKKQFNRMKQLANQTVGRAEKTEVLSDDLLQIERRLDTVRSVCHHSHKRLLACFQGQHGTDAERRHKKLPLTALAQNVQEAASQLDDSLLGCWRRVAMPRASWLWSCPSTRSSWSGRSWNPCAP
ncbi:Rho GTPase activating protein 17 [Rhinolophus ferrumequinum]|uniref:Rho GTPase activating protein 17 n=1 Tax=Rhinolophus ferrumequinum TaxID=59479 RepID=A0A7J7R7W9_RHIFE|nr:Rho GTPase activating protein 17 [Rhinolophus ferrumequinum]